MVEYQPVNMTDSYLDKIIFLPSKMKLFQVTLGYTNVFLMMMILVY